MPSRLGAMIYALTADDRDFNRTMRRSARTISAQEKEFRKLQRTVRNVGRSLAAPLIGYASIRGLEAFGRQIGQIAEDAATLVETSRRVGFATERLQTLGRVVAGEGGSRQGLFKSVERFQRSLSEAAEGAAEYRDSFDSLAVSTVTLEGNTRNAEVVFDEVVAALGRVTNEADRARLAYDIFGRSSAPLVNAAIQGNLREQEKAFAKLGVTTTEENERFKDLLQRWTNIGDAMDVSFTKFILGIEPAVNWITQFAEEFAKLTTGATSAEPQLRTLEAINEAYAESTKRIEELRAAIEPLEGLRTRDARRERGMLKAELRAIQDERDTNQDLAALYERRIELERKLETAGVKRVKAIKRALAEVVSQLDAIDESRLTPETEETGTAAQKSKDVLKEEIAERTQIWRGYWDDVTRQAEEGRQRIAASLTAPVDLVGYRPEVDSRALTGAQSAAAAATNAEHIFRTANQTIVADSAAMAANMEQAQRNAQEFVATVGSGIEPFERAKTRLEVLGETGVHAFDSMSQSIKSALLQADSFRDAAERIGRLALFQLVESFFTPNTFGGLFGGASNRLPIRRASGGPVTAGMLYSVNEAGRTEAFIPRVDGYVDHNPQGSAGLMIEAGAIQINSNQDPRVIAAAVIDAVETRQAKRQYRSQLMNRSG